MDLGFETIGNATMICHDGRPLLVTDPWLVGPAYFGSWTLSHEVPEEQLAAAKACDYVWLSHGHPDHLSGESLALFRDKEILVPNHFGGRIYGDLKRQGFKVEIMLDRAWIRLSPRVRVMCIPDYNQDAVLLVELGGTLVVNLNDAGDRGWSRLVRDKIKGYERSFLLALSGYGDADMINYRTEDGQRVLPHAALRVPVGQTIARQVEFYGVTHFVPFSSMHKYQRRDSVWASEYTTRLEDYPRGFHSRRAELTPAFIRYDVLQDELSPLHPPERRIEPVDPSVFGDDWSQRLEPGDVERLEAYVRGVQHLEAAFDFITFRVGGEDHRIELGRRKFNRGITFEAPRTSLMTAVEYEIFDDLLIGNFMKTTLHGDFQRTNLYPDFAPYVAKYSDNAGVKSKEELERYFAAYRRRDPLGFFRHQLDVHCVRPLQQATAELLRNTVGPRSTLFRASKEAFWAVRRRF